MVPVAPIITGLFVTFHMHCISIVRILYFRIFSAYFLTTILLLLLLLFTISETRPYLLLLVITLRPLDAWLLLALCTDRSIVKKPTATSEQFLRQFMT